MGEVVPIRKGAESGASIQRPRAVSWKEVEEVSVVVSPVNSHPSIS